MSLITMYKPSGFEVKVGAAQVKEMLAKGWTFDKKESSPNPKSTSTRSSSKKE